jgi:MFS family permease
MILLGVGVASIPTPLYAAVPDLVVDVKMVGLGMAVLTIGLNLGTVIGAPVFGALADSVGWNPAAYIFAPFALLGILISILNKKLR